MQALRLQQAEANLDILTNGARVPVGKLQLQLQILQGEHME